MGLIEWLSANNDNLQVAFNIPIALILYLLCVFVLMHIYRMPLSSSTSLKTMLYGVAVEAFGWATNRTYWAVSWFLQALGLEQYGPASKWGWISLIPLAISGIGLVLITTPLFINPARKISAFHHLIGFGLMVAMTLASYLVITSLILV